MSNRYLIIAATIAATAATPALATAAAAPPAAAPTAAPQAQQLPTRATLIKNLDASFKAIDTNGDGTLSQAELAAAEAKGISNRVTAMRTKMDTEFTKLDTNHDGQLSRTEFMAAAPQAPTTAPTGAQELAALDKNKDGKVSADEFRAGNPNLAMFDKIDTNHDGVISDAEKAAVQRPAKTRRP